MNPEHIIGELDPEQTLCNVLGCYVKLEDCQALKNKSNNVCNDCTSYYKMLKPGEKWDKEKQKITKIAS